MTDSPHDPGYVAMGEPWTVELPPPTDAVSNIAHVRHGHRVEICDCNYAICAVFGKHPFEDDDESDAIAMRIVACINACVGISTEQLMSDKNPFAAKLGRAGGLKGGPALAAKLTPEERRLKAQKAARTRWDHA